MFAVASLTLALASFASAAPLSLAPLAPLTAAVNSTIAAALTHPNTSQVANASYYYQNGVAGACGNVSQDVQLVVGLPLSYFSAYNVSNGIPSPYCGSYVMVTSLANNLTTLARVADASLSNDTLTTSLGTYWSLNGTVGGFEQGVAWRFANTTETAAAIVNSTSLDVWLTSSINAAASTASASSARVAAAAQTPAAPSTDAYTPAYTPTTDAYTPAYTPESTYVAPTSTYQAPTSTYQAPKATSAKSSSGGSYSGQATFFYQAGGTGACGSVHSDDSMIVAIQSAMYNGGEYCGRSVQITNTANGQSVTATVADECPGCSSSESLDLSVGAFNAIGSESSGVLPITWSFV